MEDAVTLAESRDSCRERESLSPVLGDFTHAVRSHQSLVFSLAYHMLRNRNQAEDVAQDVFLRLFRDFARIESESHLVHWLRRTTMHRCFDAQRQARGQRLSPIDEDEIAIATVDSDPWSSHHLRRFVAALPDAARAVIVLRYQEEMEPREIAEVLDLPVNTVKSRLQRALIVLRGRFAALEEAQHAATRA